MLLVAGCAHHRWHLVVHAQPHQRRFHGLKVRRTLQSLSEHQKEDAPSVNTRSTAAYSTANGAQARAYSARPCSSMFTNRRQFVTTFNRCCFSLIKEIFRKGKHLKKGAYVSSFVGRSFACFNGTRNQAGSTSGAILSFRRHLPKPSVCMYSCRITRISPAPMTHSACEVKFA